VDIWGSGFLLNNLFNLYIMTIYTVIKKYEKYFHSIRLHDTILLVDLKLPINWQIQDLLRLLQVNQNYQEQQLIGFTEKI